jgi:predicted RNA methylase
MVLKIGSGCGIVAVGAVIAGGRSKKSFEAQKKRGS